MAKTQEEIAFEMLSKLKGLGVWGEQNKDEILDLFAECLVQQAPAQHAAPANPVHQQQQQVAQAYQPPQGQVTR